MTSTLVVISLQYFEVGELLSFVKNVYQVTRIPVGSDQEIRAPGNKFLLTLIF